MPYRSWMGWRWRLPNLRSARLLICILKPMHSRCNASFLGALAHYKIILSKGLGTSYVSCIPMQSSIHNETFAPLFLKEYWKQHHLHPSTKASPASSVLWNVQLRISKACPLEERTMLYQNGVANRSLQVSHYIKLERAPQCDRLDINNQTQSKATIDELNE